MKLLSKYVNQNSLKQYYNSCGLPVFDFGCVVWGNTTIANLTRLVRLRLISDFYSETSREDDFESKFHDTF